MTTQKQMINTRVEGSGFSHVLSDEIARHEKVMTVSMAGPILSRGPGDRVGERDNGRVHFYAHPIDHRSTVDRLDQVEIRLESDAKLDIAGADQESRHRPSARRRPRRCGKRKQEVSSTTTHNVSSQSLISPVGDQTPFVPNRCERQQSPHHLGSRFSKKRRLDFNDQRDSNGGSLSSNSVDSGMLFGEERGNSPEADAEPISLSAVIVETKGGVLDFMSADEAAFIARACAINHHVVWRRLLNGLIPGGVRGEGWRLGRLDAKEAFDRRFNEKMFIADSGWLSKHRTLRKSFFPILCNWLVELHFELFGDHSRKLMCKSPLNPIHLAMKYLFRFLSLVPSITSNRLQLVGVSCYQIAVDHALGKHETEKLELDAKRYAYYTDNAYTAEEVTEMTAKIHRTLKQDRLYTPYDNLLHVFTPTKALSDLLEVLGLDSNVLVVLFAHYLVDLSMHDTSFSEVYPTAIAAAATQFACRKAGVEINSAMGDVILNSCYVGCSGSVARVVNSPFQLGETYLSMEKFYEGACKQETGTSIFNNHVLPKYSMVIKHYSTKFMEWTQGKLSPQYRVRLFKDELSLKHRFITMMERGETPPDYMEEEEGG